MKINLRPLFSLRWMMVAVAIVGILFAALRYDVGMRGYLVFLAALVLFAISSAIASKTRGPARVVALTVATLSVLAGGSAFFWFGVR